MSFRQKAAVGALVALAALPLGAQDHGARRPASAPHPMAIRVLPPSPETHAPLRYVTSEPAYVAAFIVYPGAGVRMIYPLTEREERQWSGFHNEPLVGVQFDDDAYRAVLGPTMPGPRYLYVIASRYPLDVARYVHHPSRLARDVSVATARSLDSEDDLVALVDHVVSLGDEDSWDADVYMLWQPNHQHPALADEGLTYPSRVIVCATGMSIVVPFNYPFAACPGDQRLVPLPPVKRPVSQRASTEVETPTVLPTIRGTRMSNQEQRKAGAPTNALTTTAAGGVSVVGGEPVAQQGQVETSDGTTVLVGVPVSYGHDGIERSHRERPDGFRPGSDGRDGDHRDGMRRGDGRDGRDGRGNDYREGGRVIGNPMPGSVPAPRLPPNPQPAPPPRLATPPASAPVMAAPVMHSEPAHAAPPPPPAQSTPQSHPSAPPQKVQ